MRLSRHSIVIAASLGLLACAGPRSHTTPPSSTPAPPPAVTTTEPAASEPASTPLVRLAFGAWPQSNAHRFGRRFLELKTGTDGARHVRIHDEISFQGHRMRPEDMRPPTHACTAWEPLPASAGVPAITADADCQAGARDLCESIARWYTDSAPPVADPACDQHTACAIRVQGVAEQRGRYGRPVAPCAL